MPALLPVLLCLALGRAAAQEFLPSPSRPECVFTAYSHVDCHWTPGNNTPPNTEYTLLAFFAGRNPPGNRCASEARLAFSCARTARTDCSGGMSSPDRWYSLRVVAHGATANASSPTRCVRALDAVKLRPPGPPDPRPLPGQPGCLHLLWRKPKIFALTNEDVCSGQVVYQLQYRTADQSEAQALEGRVAEHLQHLDCKKSLRSSGWVQLRVPCVFRPFTRYAVRLRHRHGNLWSEWSHQSESCTATTAPPTAPQLWRTVTPLHRPQRRRVTLLWKPPSPSQTLCTSLWFNASCQPEGSHHAAPPQSCHGTTEASCQLTLPPRGFSCLLTVSNPAGASPPARVTVSAPAAAAIGVVTAMDVTALSDSSLEVGWEADTPPSLTGFLLEWEPTSGSGDGIPKWERLSRTSNRTIVSGLQPEVRYTVTINPEFSSESSGAMSTHTYTKEGVPSAGPTLQVQEQSGSSVLLVWTPPPVQHRHGFITHYSLYCQQEDSSQREVHAVAVDAVSHRLSGLDGLHRIAMTAHTVAGEGPAGPPVWVTVEKEEYSLRAVLLCVVLTATIVAVSLVFAVYCQRMKRSIWPQVPDPALSSLTTWITSVPERSTGRKLFSPQVSVTSTARLTHALYDQDHG